MYVVVAVSDPHAPSLSLHLNMLFGRALLLSTSCVEPRPSALPSSIDLLSLLNPNVNLFCNSTESVAQNETVSFAAQGYQLSSSVRESSGDALVPGNVTICLEALAQVLDQVRRKEIHPKPCSVSI